MISNIFSVPFFSVLSFWNSQYVYVIPSIVVPLWYFLFFFFSLFHTRNFCWHTLKYRGPFLSHVQSTDEPIMLVQVHVPDAQWDRNNPKCQSLEQRKIYCMAMQGKGWLMLPEYPKLPKPKLQSIFKDKMREGLGCLLQASWCRNPLFLQLSIEVRSPTKYMLYLREELKQRIWGKDLHSYSSPLFSDTT